MSAAAAYRRGSYAAGVDPLPRPGARAYPLVGEATTLLYPDEANYPPGSHGWYRARQRRLLREQREGRPRGLPIVGDFVGDVGDALERKARAELYLKAAAVGVAAIGAIGLLAYALRQ